MKVLLLALSFITISHSALAGNGWSSSGVGEYIVDKNNPWFMGDAPVTWCIDHGGEEKFSLSLQKSKLEIEKAIDVLASQLKHINQNDGDMAVTPLRNHNRKCGLAQVGDQGDWGKECESFATKIQMSDKFSFVSDCKNADIQFILGNINNEHVQSLIQKTGKENFENLAGVAIRTDYSLKTFRGKGFIYIAADKGDLQYSGPRNIHFGNKNETIWDNFDKISSDTLFPERIVNKASTENVQYIYKLKLKDYSVSTLQAVVAHEFGHVLGLGHNHFNIDYSNGNIMDEDYPANIISDGLVFKGNFKRESMILSRGLIETKTEHRIGFEWSTNRIKWDNLEVMPKYFPAVSKFLLDIPEKYKENYSTSLFLIFDIDALDSEQANIQIATYERNKFEYKIHKTYKIEMELCTFPTLVESINLRSLEFKSIPLLRLETTHFCGKILLGGLKNKSLIFRLSHSYFQSNSELELYDSNSQSPFRIWLTDSDIFSYSNSTQTLPAPMPAFEFE